MNVTKDVIQDLVVVYLAGDASADTRRLVEEFFGSPAANGTHHASPRAPALS